jgi:acetoin utilization deacetylase AcuC-like enzyme
VATAFYTDPQLDAHTLAGHPEHAGRRQAAVSLLEKHGILAQLSAVAALPAPDDLLARVHHPHYVERLFQAAPANGIGYIDNDTYLTPTSPQLARVAVGGVLGVVEAVLTGRAPNGIALMRPPGHHATPRQAMGFCLLNNIAIAARYAQQHGLERVAIVDFDVHHGNGTQDAFYGDPSVLFISSHQSPLYPGTGRLEERGRGDGLGYTLNLPLPPYSNDATFQAVYSQVVGPALQRFQPQLILVSAGFDAHFMDPLAQLAISLAGFDAVCRALLGWAEALCEGKIVFVMEGGYDLKALSHAWWNVALVLLGQPAVADPYGHPKASPDLNQALIDMFKKAHLGL